MTKKEFKSMCSFHEYGRGQNKHNAIYFDWKSSNGYKYMVKANVQDCLKSELLTALYNWITKQIQPDWFIEYRFAETDEKRFKVSIVG
jgi:hypothetical protein